MKKEIHQVDGKFYEKCQVVMLPTKEKAIPRDLVLSCTGKLRLLDVDDKTGNFIKQHLYILSNEEIKEGDWLLADGYNNMHPKHLGIAKADKEQLNAILQGFTAKKIIATTDESLNIETFIKKKSPAYRLGDYIEWSEKIKQILPRPSNEFLKKYCELNGIQEVLVEYEKHIVIGDDPGFREEDGYDYNYRLKISLDNTITIKPVQEDKLYTREEVEKLMALAWDKSLEVSNNMSKYFYSDDKGINGFIVKGWIKQNL